ncbi:hypothetical protein EBU99_12975 [bacterium]|nr:hypothetical protein [bacterium]
MNKKRLGIVVPHTHWDRAWYLPFQAYRLRFMEMLDSLLSWLEQGTCPLFVLDGQTVLLDDAFEIRPEARSRVERLVRAGKMKVGPWYTMPDLFLARPEALIRNLQRGIHSACELGGASRVGYVPDSFGHFAQLPQIFAGFKINSFLFMRGMPEALRDSAGALFEWRAPNGSSVFATYLREGYFPLGALGQESFHGRYDGLPANLPSARDRLSQTLARLEPVQKESVFVLPAGGDHLPARDDLADVVAALNQQQSEIELRFGSFEDYLSALDAENSYHSEANEFSAQQSITQQATPWPVFEGDLLGQADHPLLRNVLSSRVDLKILNHKAQALLTGVVEPLLALSCAEGLPCVELALLQKAWDALLKNHAHDDICGCSVDEVHLDDLQRFHEVRALGREIITRQLEHWEQKKWQMAAHGLLAAQHADKTLHGVRVSRVVVFNPHPWSSTQRVQATVLLPDDGGEFSQPSKACSLSAVSSQGALVDVTVLATACKDIRNNYLETSWGRSYQIEFEAQLPALGFEVFTIFETTTALSAQVPVGEVGDSADELLKQNLHQAVDKNAPRVLIETLDFELDADLGDGYSFGPCPEIATRRAALISAQADPVRKECWHLRYEICGHSFVKRDALRSKPLENCVGPQGRMTLDVLAKNTPQGWLLSLSYTNIFKDSRLRVVFKQREAAKTLIADGQALWMQHSTAAQHCEIWPGPLATPRYPGEMPYPVHHTNDGVVLRGAQQDFYCGGVGLHEFEILDAHKVAFTLHRAVGFLSVRGGRIRSCQAGPQRPTPDAQLQTNLAHTLVFGCVRESNPSAAMRCLKEALQPAWIQELPALPVGSAANKTQTASAPEQSSSPHAVEKSSLVDVGATRLQLMACKPAGASAVFLRLLNPSEQAFDAKLLLNSKFNFAQEFELDDLTPRAGKAAALLDDTLVANFKPYEIKTWKLTLC